MIHLKKSKIDQEKAKLWSAEDSSTPTEQKCKNVAVVVVITANFAKIWQKRRVNLKRLTYYLFKVYSFCQSDKR